MKHATVRNRRGTFFRWLFQHATESTTVLSATQTTQRGHENNNVVALPLLLHPALTRALIQELAEKDVRRRIAAIEDEIHLGREKAYADAVYYAHIKEADSNDRLLTDNFLEYSRILR